MTDKEIIIDSIDVSKCRYLFDDTSYKRSKTSCSITLKDCKYLGDKCYFKQLKRKEQECEELRGRLNTICFDPRANNNRCISYNRMAEDYAKLIKYKTLFLKAREIYQRTLKYNQQLIEENKDLKDTIKRFTCQSECYKYKETKKYKQALDEIMKNIKAINNECFYGDIYECDNCDMRNGCSYYRKFKILDIINKVKEK